MQPSQLRAQGYYGLLCTPFFFGSLTALWTSPEAELRDGVLLAEDFGIACKALMLASLLERGSQAVCAALCRTIVAQYGLDIDSTTPIELRRGFSASSESVFALDRPNEGKSRLQSSLKTSPSEYMDDHWACYTA